MRLLEGYFALDLTDLTGQFCGKLLCDLGMEVVKIEPPEGDPVRRLGPFKDDQPHPEGSLRFAYLNAGKKSVALDLTGPSGQEYLLRLVEQADVVLVSSPPAELDRRGLTEAALRQRNPRLVYTAVTGFGLDGPYRDFAWNDLIGLAMGGVLFISGDAALPPVRPPETQANYFASVFAALGTLLALWRRQGSGRGAQVDVALQESIAIHEHLIRAFGTEGHSIQRHGSQHEHVAPANLFPTSDGYVHLFVSGQHWQRFLEIWPDHPAELDDPEFARNHVRRARTDLINERVSAFTSRYTKLELTELMQRQGIPCMPVNLPSEFMRDEQVQARGLFQTTTHPLLGTYPQVALPVLLDEQREPVAPPPLLGEHTRAVLCDRLGLAPDELKHLAAPDVVGSQAS